MKLLYLSPDWITDNRMDSELTFYRLKAFIQNVKKSYQAIELNPAWQETRYHYRRLISFKKSWEEAQHLLPRECTGMDWKNLCMQYKNMYTPEEWEDEMNTILTFAEMQFQALSQEGQAIFNEILQALVFDVVGVEPLYKKEGYIILFDGNHQHIYRYGHSLHTVYDDIPGGMEAYALEKINPSLINTTVNIKHKLIQNYPELPNPATYYFESKYSWPVEESLLPVAMYYLKNHIRNSDRP